MTNSGLFQGMEDVLVLEDMLKQHPDDRKKAFEAYSLHRQTDAHAIVDLAMYNYIEVRFHCLELQSDQIGRFLKLLIAQQIWTIVKNGTFYVKLMWILFGQLLYTIGVLFTPASGDTGNILEVLQVTESVVWVVVFPRLFQRKCPINTGQPLIPTNCVLTKRQMHIMHITMHYICIYNAYTKRQMHIPKDKCI